MSATFEAIGGGIDNITDDTESNPMPTDDELWAEIQTDNNGNAISYILYASDGTDWYKI